VAGTRMAHAMRLTIPFAAIKSFADPSVESALASAEPSAEVVTLGSFRKR